MYLKISEEALAKLAPYDTEDTVFVLDLDDGVGKYSKMGVCSLDTSFRLLVLNKEQERSDYEESIKSDAGEIYIKEYSKIYMAEEMTLAVDPRLQVLKLESPSGTLDNNVPIVDLRSAADQ
ncbi:iron-sulfur cluster biosynthesis family protein [Enterococcus mediterraneensis]|uniref:iron-sulfur cluster biosynthesis family protein n=1 Tax=Enterococcus mediterraneensis TaxID=2364791 RepID=UPI000F04D1CE|nr:iron-sulfur cluster biosynthesis family protein [Enterococcus mediterraneensis]